MAETKKDNKMELQKEGMSLSQRFTSMVIRNYAKEVGKIELDPYRQILAQHLFVAADNSLRTLEMRRLDRGGQGSPITWANVDMNKLAVDAVHRIELGLDALVPRHLYTIPYYNKRSGKYDVDLRIGYEGELYVHLELALERPVEVVLELVHENDKFAPIKKQLSQDVEGYKFDITNSFDRGGVVGGFGYIRYQDPTKNKLVLVTRADFDKARKKAKSDEFWGNYPEEMMFKTLIRRVVKHIPLDPKKINKSYHIVEADNVVDVNDREIEENANQDYIDIPTETAAPVQEEETPPAPAPAKPKQKEPDTKVVWLDCPPEIEPDEKKSPINECKKCVNRDQCNSYLEWKLEEKKRQEQPSQAPLF
jgi:recombination protein RecT